MEKSLAMYLRNDLLLTSGYPFWYRCSRSRFHPPGCVENFRERNDEYTHKQWYAYSADLNPFKDVWDML